MNRTGLIETANLNQRSVEQIVESQTTLEGGGFTVHRPFPTRTMSHFDPFLLLDNAGPQYYAPGQAKGAPDHPHRGFETLTYLLEGSLDNWDSSGFKGHLGPGDIEWTTAGKGIIHGGLPDARIMEHGGTMHVIQLWVNLASDKKWIPPQSTDLRADQVPSWTSDDGTINATLVAGDAWGKSATINTTTPIFYLLYDMKPGATIEQQVPSDFNVMAYVLDGDGTFGSESTKASDQQMVQFARNGDGIQLTAGLNGLRLILLGGQVLNEPVARYGPFVMNTRKEIMEAINDFEAGVFHARSSN